MHHKFSASVVMTTYNGENFLLPQLDSILKQTHSVDECIICDDCSSDGTVALIENFIHENHLENAWKLVKNNTNKGCTENFLQGMRLASKDVVFLADQDDVWNVCKVENMLKIFTIFHAKFVHCSAHKLYDGKIKKTFLAFLIHLGAPKPKRVFPVSLSSKIHNGWSSGHQLAFCRELVPEIINFSRCYQLPHDLPIGAIAAIRGGYYFLDEKLVCHRIHTANLSKPTMTFSSSIRNFQKQIISRQLKYREMWGIKHLYWNQLSPQEQQQLDEAIELTKQAIIGLKTGKISKLLPLLFSRNQMMNRMLAVRNILAILWGNKK